MQPRVVIIGAGFAGLAVAQELGSTDAEVLLIDRSNHHLFQPLLYQVATGLLSESDIASPIREVMRKHANVRVLMGEVTAIDREGKLLTLENGQQMPYDYLVVATGAQHSYFGHPEWEEMAPGIKSLEDALSIRDRILSAFELAERCGGREAAQCYLRFVIVGGGPTGVELAGAIAEMAHKGMRNDFRLIDPRHVGVYLLEAAPRILSSFSESLSDKATQFLEKLGVEVMTNTCVTAVTEEGVYIDNKLFPAATVLWAAGNQASPLLKTLNLPTDRAGRILVEPDLSVPGHPELFVLGDAAHCRSKAGTPLPAVATVALQQGRYVGNLLRKRTPPEQRRPFSFRSKGQMATVGRFHAICESGFIQMAGFWAWMLWASIHIMYLIDFANRFVVLTRWFFWLFFGRHTGRLILQSCRADWTHPLLKKGACETP
jgi:NADH:ubiquinone reductase (H+-translocating)